MPLTLCSNCRLPVNAAAAQCPQCAAVLRTRLPAKKQVPVAAAIAVAAGLALIVRRLA